MRIAITGNTGFVGRNLTSLLARSPGSVVLLRDPGEPVPGTVVVPTELTDAEALASVFAGHQVDAVIHLAGRTSIPESLADPVGYLTVNAALTDRVFAAAGMAGVSAVVLASSAEVYGPLSEGLLYHEDHPVRPAAPYGIAKVTSELIALHYAQRHGLRGIVLRSGNIFGPHQQRSRLIPTVTRTVLRGEEPALVRGGSPVHEWLYVEDFCAATVHCLTAEVPTGVYNVGSGQSLSVRSVVRMVSGLVTGDPVTVSPGPGLLDDRRLRALSSWRPAHDFTSALRTTVTDIAGARKAE